MAVKLRLARRGAKKRPFYHIVVADVRSSRDGKYIEKVGTYNPMLPKDSDQRVLLDTDRVKHWLGNGAQPTERVALFLGKAGLIDMPARTERPQKSKPKAKAVERAEARVEKEEARKQAEIDAKEAAKAEAAAAKEAAAAPKEEAPAEEEAKTEDAPAAEAETEKTADAA